MVRAGAAGGRGPLPAVGSRRCYRVAAEGLGRWLELQIALLETGVFFGEDPHACASLERAINGPYIRKFPGRVPLD